MEKLYISVILISILCFSFIGCASLGSRIDFMGGTLSDDKFYPGTRYDLKEVSDSCGGKSFAMTDFIDIPFSFVLDTIMLPFDVFLRHEPVKRTKTEAIRHTVTSPGNETIQSGQ